MTSPARGLRLSYLRHFINSHGGETSFAGKTTAQVCFEFVVPLTKPTELSLVDHVANDPTTASFVAPANWYVSHAWQYLFLETVDSLERFFADRGLTDDAVIWFCVFNNNQHLASSYPFEYWSTTFKDSLATIGNMVMIMHPWNDPIVLRRSWCVFEVYVAVTMGARFEIALARDQEATFLGGIGQYGAFVKMLATIKSENSEATVPSDRDGIFAWIRAETSFVAVDRLIFSTLSTWIKTTLESSIGALSSPVQQAYRWRALGWIYLNDRNCVDAERCFARDLSHFTTLDGRSARLDVASAQVNVGMTRGTLRKPAHTWQPLFESALAVQTELLGPSDREVFATKYSFVAALTRNDLVHDAKTVALDLFDAHRHVYGIASSLTAVVMSLVTEIVHRLHDPRTALRWSRKTAAVQEQFHGSDHVCTILTLQIASAAYLALGRFDEGLALNQRVLATAQRTLGADHKLTLAASLNEGSFLLQSGDVAGAMAILRSVRALCPAANAPVHYKRDAELYLGHAVWTSGDVAAATDHFLAAHRILPGKDTVAAIYRVATADPMARCHLLALVTEAICSDVAPEWWPTNCVLCSKPIRGVLISCAACPKGAFWFCRVCSATKRERLERFCQHDLPAAQLETVLPPRRQLYHDALLTHDGSYKHIESLLDDYATYCNTHDVPPNERLPRPSIPTLNRGWHPML
ncbi:hypothetical protein SPRG_15784 [Saprolegnia parasitica CBS 223.65]|uniref:MalT-like TPR region domain-containing protein n=1 Tax=Saprolegnia parasitica (strain CBS 223.65) TaxID=695850 RepID=A0A067BLA6_SAPPC|nr:hypothetical protein SPRG_15784 [Saprolegnia parasitica CBS 223.65]KDO18993.1 hypothetical protein SPRG_15784 [Saprolegnia parasitica CBS 223.65]|eukprot:XP_012210310.1 hypothetical protein SPRG_15784 [Saprolegnia parasitica CBS 223.65]